MTIVSGQRLSNPALIALLAALCLAPWLAACNMPSLTPPTETPTPSPSDTPTLTATPTATLVPTETASPTPSSTPTATPTPTDTPTITPTPTLYALVNAAQRVNVRSGPGTRFAAIDSMAPGDGAPVIERNEDGSWLQLRLDNEADEEAVGWVSAALLQVNTPPPPIPPEPAADYLLLLDMPIVDQAAAQATATAIAELAQATATPLPAATAAPDSAIAPAATPRHDVRVFAFCDQRSYGVPPPAGLTRGSTINIFWAWFASSEAYIWQHIEHAAHDLRVNGQPIAELDSFRQTPRRDGSQYVVYWYVPFGPLAAGSYEISYRVSWRQAISDGYARFGPGTDSESESESCTFTVR